MRAGRRLERHCVKAGNLGQELDVQRAMEGGAVAYRIKANLSLDDLVKQVKQVLGLEAAPAPAAVAEEPRVGKWAKR